MARKRIKQKRAKQSVKAKKMLCFNSESCTFTTTCPTFHRVCNSNSKCCKKCIDFEFCPMKGMK